MKRLTVAVVILAFVAMSSPAFGAARYCGTSTKYHGLSKTTYVGPAWDRPGYRLMQTRKVWSSTSSYYICRR